MNIQDFFKFSSKYHRSTFQAFPEDNNDDHKNIWEKNSRLIKGQYFGINFPVIFKQIDGKNITDILDTGSMAFHLISDRLKTILIDNSMTGWKTYPIKLYDKKNNEILGYNGFSITGTSGRLSYENSEIIHKKYIPEGPLRKFYKGESIELDKWDGSDFFIPEDSLRIIITKKTCEILYKSKVTNFKVERLDEIEIDIGLLNILKSK